MHSILCEVGRYHTLAVICFALVFISCTAVFILSLPVFVLRASVSVAVVPIERSLSYLASISWSIFMRFNSRSVLTI